MARAASARKFSLGAGKFEQNFPRGKFSYIMSGQLTLIQVGWVERSETQRASAIFVGVRFVASTQSTNTDFYYG